METATPTHFACPFLPRHSSPHAHTIILPVLRHTPALHTLLQTPRRHTRAKSAHILTAPHDDAPNF